VKAWVEAWQDALYGPRGFYRSPAGPRAHFSTATHGPTGRVLAEALLRLADDRGLAHVVDIGAGRGELLEHLYAARPALRLTGLDVVARPEGLPAPVEWLVSPGGAGLPEGLRDLDRVLVLAHEWLDVVPCPVAEVDDEGRLRHRLVEPDTGTEEWGPLVAGVELAWAGHHWFTTTPGDRVEIGTTRDAAWQDLLARIGSGVAIAVDYGHTGGDRPAQGTLAAYKEGVVVAPVPDGTCDLTAHVAMDSLDHDDLLDQRTLLRGLGVDGRVPPHELAQRDPQGYLRGLERASAAAALTDPGGFGGFLWAVKELG
jgi:SAM-dependent MidA family methyltransferase